MRKFFILGAAIVVSVAMLLTSCKKEEVNDNGNNSNTENPGGGGSGGTDNPGGGSGSDDHVIPNAVSDIDGNCYDAVQIGNQVWMAENLRTTRYADGTTIPLGTSSSTIMSYRYNPNNDANNVPTYGYLYNWPAVMHGASSSSSNPSGVQGICPNGWHVPSDAEWTQLTDYMRKQPEYMASGDSNHLAKALAATWGWRSTDRIDAPGHSLSTNNATGFSALPAGSCHSNYSIDDYGVSYSFFCKDAYFWSTTESTGRYAYGRVIFHDFVNVYKINVFRDSGCSVRCVRD